MQSGRSRGFGFVYYEAPEDAREVGCTAFVSSYSYVVFFYSNIVVWNLKVLLSNEMILIREHFEIHLIMDTKRIKLGCFKVILTLTIIK